MNYLEGRKGGRSLAGNLAGRGDFSFFSNYLRPVWGGGDEKSVSHPDTLWMPCGLTDIVISSRAIQMGPACPTGRGWSGSVMPEQ